MVALTFSEHGEAEVSHGKQHFSVVAEPAGPAKCGPLILSDNFHIVFPLFSTDNGRVCRKSSRTKWSRFAPFRQNLTRRDHCLQIFRIVLLRQISCSPGLQIRGSLDNLGWARNSKSSTLETFHAFALL